MSSNKNSVSDIHSLIKNQPLEKDKLIRFERLKSGSYDDYAIGDVLDFGVRSATRDKTFKEVASISLGRCVKRLFYLSETYLRH